MYGANIFISDHVLPQTPQCEWQFEGTTENNVSDIGPTLSEFAWGSRYEAVLLLLQQLALPE